MIYTRWESKVEIIQYNGLQTMPGFNGKMTLVKVKFDYDGSTGYRFAEFLKTNSGINEIVSETNNAPFVELSGDDLDTAIKEAM